jgi:NADH-ubiquinone oxidoreductase chain 2
MAGIPPFIGFFGKQSVIYSAIDSGFYFMTFVAILVSVISAAYYLRLIKESYSHSTGDSNISSEKNKETQLNSENIHLPKEKKEYSVMSSFVTFLDYILKIERNYVELKVLNLSNIHAFIISLLTFTLIFFFLNPSILMNSASLITLNYFYL